MSEKRTFFAKFGGQSYEFDTAKNLEDHVASEQTGYGQRTVAEEIKHLEKHLREANSPFKMILKAAQQDPTVLDEVFKRNPGFHQNLTRLQKLYGADQNRLISHIDELDDLT